MRFAGQERSRLRGVTAWVLALGGLVAVTAGGCGGPTYPGCDNDEQCNQDGHTGVCVAHTCVQCRTSEACGAGKTCRLGACEAIPGFCDATHPCDPGMDCGSDNRCHSAKTVASAPAVECDDTKPCGTGQRCQNGHCVSPPQGGPGCTDFPSPKFDFDSPTLSSSGRETLTRLAKCITTGSLKGGEILFTGHCDNQGEAEYNMSLGADRAQAAKMFITGLGVSDAKIRTSSRGELDATGTDETSAQDDRRVDIEVR